MLLAALLLSSQIVFQFATRTALARDWRVVNVPDDKSKDVNFIDFYMKIVEHILDPLTVRLAREQEECTHPCLDRKEPECKWFPRRGNCESVWCGGIVWPLRQVLCAVWRTSLLIPVNLRPKKECIWGMTVFDLSWKACGALNEMNLYFCRFLCHHTVN